jgi:hypothetical protein
MNSSLAHPPPASALQENEYDAMLPWLHHLRCIFPISRALVVGAGNGSDCWVGFLNKTSIEAVTLVEADEICFQQLQRATADRPTWTLCHQMIAPDRGPSTFHRTTVPCENGLFDAEALHSLWPRIATRESINLNAITLADVMDGLPQPADWLFIDCLPALPILQSAGPHLSLANVILARVTASAVGPRPAQSAREPIAQALDALGFQCLTFEPNRNPKTGHALFLRKPSVSARDNAKLKATINDLERALTAKDSAIQEMQSKHSAERAHVEESIAHFSSELERMQERERDTSATLSATRCQLSLLERFLAE